MSMAVFSLSDPAPNFAAITPSDSAADNFKPSRGVYVGGTGDVVAVSDAGSAVTFKAVPAGTVLPVRCVRVNSTNTTATDLVRLW